MGVHCDLTELGINTMAVKSLAVVLSPASLLPSLDTAMAMVMPPVIPTDPPMDSMVVMEDMAMVAIMARGRLRPSPATAMAAMVAMAPPLCMCPRLTMAEAEPGYGYGAVSYHPYGGSSSVYRSTQGLTGGYGYSGYYGKRSAEPGYYGGGHSFVHQSRPYYHGSYGYNINHSYGKRPAEPGYGYGYYGGASSHQYVSRPYSHYGVGIAHPYSESSVYSSQIEIVPSYFTSSTLLIKNCYF